MIIPFWWKAGGVAVLVVLLGLWHGAQVKTAYADGHAAAVAQRAAQDALAVSTRLTENAATSVKQAATNVAITKVKNEEITPVRRRIAADRVRIGRAICGPTSAPIAESSASSDGTNPSGRMVRADIERDIRALKLAVEEDLATGRACQAFLLENGLTP